MLKCSQTGEIVVAKIRDLYREDTESVMDLSKGAELLYESHGKVYPAPFVSFKGYNFFA